MSDPERQRIRDRKRRTLEQAMTEQEPERPGEPIPVADSKHLESLVNTHAVVLVDCYADWCGPCKMIEPTIEAIAADSEAVVAKLDVDRHTQIAQELGVRGVPTLLLYAGGEAVERFVGVQDRGTLEDAIAAHA